VASAERENYGAGRRVTRHLRPCGASSPKPSTDWTIAVYIPTFPPTVSTPENVSATPLLRDKSHRCFDAESGTKNCFTKPPKAGVEIIAIILKKGCGIRMLFRNREWPNLASTGTVLNLRISTEPEVNSPIRPDNLWYRAG
jgi:hypothetical protein